MGEGYTIKSINNDAMVYFFGRLPNGVKGREIEMEKSKGKIVKISNYERDLLIDFGFENCSTVLVFFKALLRLLLLLSKVLL